MQEFVPPAGAVIEADPNVCPECQDRGWRLVADGGAGTAVACDCRKRDRGREYLAQAGIPERYRHCRLSNFTTSNADRRVQTGLQGALKTSQLYVDSFFDPGTSHFLETGLIFIGIPGTGKTHLAVAVLAELIQRYGARGRFVDFTALIHQIQSTFDPTSAESKHEVLDPVIKAEVLVLDELGAQKPTEWVRDTLYLIINTRYLQRLPTIFTTNYQLELKGGPRPGLQGTQPAKRVHSEVPAARALEPSSSQELVDTPRSVNPFADLKTRISPLLVSRLYEMAEPVKLPSSDFREKVKVAQNRIWRQRATRPT